MCMSTQTICFLSVTFDMALQIREKEPFAHSLGLVPANVDILKERLTLNSNLSKQIDDISNINNSEWISKKVVDTTESEPGKFDLNVLGFVNAIQSFYPDITFYSRKVENVAYWSWNDTYYKNPFNQVKSYDKYTKQESGGYWGKSG